MTGLECSDIGPTVTHIVVLIRVKFGIGERTKCFLVPILMPFYFYVQSVMLVSLVSSVRRSTKLNFGGSQFKLFADIALNFIPDVVRYGAVAAAPHSAASSVNRP